MGSSQGEKGVEREDWEEKGAMTRKGGGHIGCLIYGEVEGEKDSPGQIFFKKSYSHGRLFL